ncbi:ankyrin repeat-containing domain protein [Chaetomidium leptoderma]|uniref:Ankyrin repeat-containing domain protein n=1 Tax=Chaetomidium leptoderma TaxID=669021 RepID=A0AAN6ZTH7_9PEZI|nr:ankyrin repeat-containing domain protein [Chaetomidium leptoderma]
MSLPAFATGPRQTDEQYVQRVASYPFYQYASRYWAAHLKDVGDLASQSALQTQVLSFLGNRACVASSAQALMRASGHGLAAPTVMSPLSLVSYLDLPDLASSLPPDDEQGSSLIHWSDSLGRTPLMWAACGGSVLVVRLLLDRGSVRDYVDNVGEDALLLAIPQGHTNVVLELLEQGLPIEAPTTKSPLIRAAECGHRGIVQILLDQGAIPGSVLEHGETAMHNAAANGHLEVLEVLIHPAASWGFGLDHQNHEDETALFAAAFNGHAEPVKILLKIQDSVDKVTKVWCRSEKDFFSEVLQERGFPNLPSSPIHRQLL